MRCVLGKLFLMPKESIEILERRAAVNNQNIWERFIKKWHKIENKVP